jgi:hypothetical protein
MHHSLPAGDVLQALLAGAAEISVRAAENGKNEVGAISLTTYAASPTGRTERHLQPLVTRLEEVEINMRRFVFLIMASTMLVATLAAAAS